jgi:hypothetical protein
MAAGRSHLATSPTRSKKTCISGLKTAKTLMGFGGFFMVFDKSETQAWSPFHVDREPPKNQFNTPFFSK